MVDITAAVTEELSEIFSMNSELYSIPEVVDWYAYLITSRQICSFGILSYQDCDLSLEADHHE